MEGKVTYTIDGVEHEDYYDYPLVHDEATLVAKLHECDIRKQQGAWLRENIDFKKSDIFIGFAHSYMPTFESRMANIKLTDFSEVGELGAIKKLSMLGKLRALKKQGGTDENKV